VYFCISLCSYINPDQYHTYQGEEEGMEGDEGNENDSDDHDPQKIKERNTPLWKYVTKLTRGKGGGIGKFICQHCHIEYTGSYTCVRKYLCGTMYWDEDKSIGIKTFVKVDSEEKLQYQREEEVAQNKAKKPKCEHQNTQRMFNGRVASAHGSALSPSPSRRTLSDFLDQGCRDDVDAKHFRFLYMHVVYHSMFFTHHIGMKWSKPSMVPLTYIGSLGMTKLEPWELTWKSQNPRCSRKFYK
jgi:hypothetical protein